MYELGDLVERDGARFIVVELQPRITPFRKRGQLTRNEGWTLGLRDAGYRSASQNAFVDMVPAVLCGLCLESHVAGRDCIDEALRSGWAWSERALNWKCPRCLTGHI